MQDKVKTAKKPVKKQVKKQVVKNKLVKKQASGEKALNPRPGIPISKEIILQLIKEHRGNLSRCADAIGTTRGCLRRKCQDDEELSQALADARERAIDELEESALDRAIREKDTTLQIFLLKTQGRSRGYDQDTAQQHAQTIAQAAFDFVLNKSKNPAEQG